MASDPIGIYISHRHTRDELFDSLVDLLDSIPDLDWKLITDVEYDPETDPVAQGAGVPTDSGMVNRRRAINRVGVMSEADVMIVLPDHYDTSKRFSARHVHNQMLQAKHKDVPMIAMEPEENADIHGNILRDVEEVSPWNSDRLGHYLARYAGS